MARIKGANTRPEKVVRSFLHRRGYRFRIHWKAAPGRPDLAFPSRRKLVYVHGCFWHHHEGCRIAHIPKTRSEYWAGRFAVNQERDARQLALAHEQGWDTQVVWECEVKDEAVLGGRLVAFLGPCRL